jgi:hypothetical protein
VQLHGHWQRTGVLLWLVVQARYKFFWKAKHILLELYVQVPAGF